MQPLMTVLREQWRGLSNRVQSTWFWRVYGICAMQKLWTKFLVAVAIMAGFWGGYFGVALLNPILPLHQLSQTQGVLVHVYQPPRTVHGSKIRIRLDSGEEITFRGSMVDDARTQLQAAKGKRVTVWSQPYYELWLPLYYEKFWQVQEADHVLLSFANVYESRLRFRPTDVWLSKFMLALTILSLAIVTLACRRGATAE